jgi:3-oxoacyl-[acyl-carrier-protein] synthase-1
MVEFIDDNMRDLDRLVALAVPAAKEAIAPLLKNRILPNKLHSLPICLGLAYPRPGYESNIEGSILSHLETETAIPFSKTDSFTISTGHASSLMGIEKAVQLIVSGKQELMLVGGVDSYYHPDILEWLDESKRLHSAENKDGFIPGEGAGFCLVASLDFTNRYRLKPLAIILSPVSGEEPNPFMSDGVCIGQGLTDVLHRAFAVLADDEVADWVICDMNGESFRALEWTYAYLRTSKQHRDPLEIWHPADCYGDIGAASGTVLTGIAIAALNKRYSRGMQPLVWTSSDYRHRSAVILSLPDKRES